MAGKINTFDRRRKVKALHRRDGSLCHWCDRELDFRSIYDSNWIGHPELGWLPTLDHYIPKANGGSNKNKNLVLACSWCNNKRGHKTPNQFRAWLRKHARGLTNRTDPMKRGRRKRNANKGTGKRTGR